jgi:hypothetical protein
MKCSILKLFFEIFRTILITDPNATGLFGIVGAILGGFLAGLLGIGASGFVGTIIIAFIGACILIAILRAVSTRYPYRR